MANAFSELASGIGNITKAPGQAYRLAQNLANPNVNYLGYENPGIRAAKASLIPDAQMQQYQQQAQAKQQTAGDNTTQQNSGVYAGGGTGAGGSGADNSLLLAQLLGQENGANRTLNDIGSQEQQGMNQINTDFAKQSTQANLDRSRALEDFQNKTVDTTSAKNKALESVDTGARTLANSVRQMIGNASGSGSSAYQLAAPSAIARKESLGRANVQDTFGKNFGALDTAKTRAEQDFGTLLQNLNDKKTQAVNGLHTGLEGTKQQLNGTLADIAAQRAALQGGGAAGALAAAAPFQSKIDASGQAIKDILARYQSPFSNITPVQVAAPTLQDYSATPTNIATAPANGQASQVDTTSPYAAFLKQQDDTNNLYNF